MENTGLGGRSSSRKPVAREGMQHLGSCGLLSVPLLQPPSMVIGRAPSLASNPSSAGPCEGAGSGPAALASSTSGLRALHCPVEAAKQGDPQHHPAQPE